MARGHGHMFTSLGELTLKGLPEPVASFAVQWEPLAAGVPLPPRVTKAALAMFGRDAESQALAAARAQVDALRVSGFDYPPDVPWTSLVTALSLVVSDLQDRPRCCVDMGLVIRLPI